MKKYIGKLFLFLLGYKVTSLNPNEYKKCVIVAAPHTTNWDFPITLSVLWYLGVDLRFFIKDTYTKPILYGWMFKWMGAIPVDRKQKNDLVAYAVDLFKNTDSLSVLIPAEGTRSKVDRWKKGFYYISKAANVPIACGYLNYKDKEAGIGKVISLEEKTQEEVFTELENYFKPFHQKTKFPENYNPTIF